MSAILKCKSDVSKFVEKYPKEQAKVIGSIIFLGMCAFTNNDIQVSFKYQELGDSSRVTMLYKGKDFDMLNIHPMKAKFGYGGTKTISKLIENKSITDSSFIFNNDSDTAELSFIFNYIYYYDNVYKLKSSKGNEIDCNYTVSIKKFLDMTIGDKIHENVIPNISTVISHKSILQRIIKSNTSSIKPFIDLGLLLELNSNIAFHSNNFNPVNLDSNNNTIVLSSGSVIVEDIHIILTKMYSKYISIKDNKVYLDISDII